MGIAHAANDLMVRRLETELDEKTTFANGIIERANAGNRDLSADDQAMLVETRGRMEDIKGQLDNLLEVSKVGFETRNRSRMVGAEIDRLRGTPVGGEVEYRSAGSYIVDMYAAYQGNRDASDRLDLFHRDVESRAAAHQRTSDNAGTIPTPIVGDVINFIDTARPLVNALGVRPLPGQNWSRPRVTAHTAIALQGSQGLQADEKAELVSQRMTISKIAAQAQTYGGYVNLSRQNLDFSTPDVFDIVVNDLAGQYAIQTEAVAAAQVAATTTTAVGMGATPTAQSVSAALWTAAGLVYAATKGQGGLILVCSPDMLGTFGPLFAPVNPQNAQSSGLLASSFGQGSFGVISGIQGIMSAGLGTGKAFLLSTAGVEVYEQRIGTLQVVEPSVLGLQVAYAGYFTPMTIENAAIVPLTKT